MVDKLMAGFFDFEHPQTIDPNHIEVLAKRAISKDFALASHLSTRYDNEVRKVGFGSGYSGSAKSEPLQGLCITFVDPWTKEAVAYRLRPDTPLSIDGKPAKYLSRTGEKQHLFFPHTSTAERLEDAKIPMVIAEAELKALAVAENLEAMKKPFAVVGLTGVNGAWGRAKESVMLPEGGHEKQNHGPAKLISDFDKIAFKNRLVYIVFDSDVGTPKHAADFKKSKHSGAMGAEHVLAELLRSKGADVRIVVIPHPDTGDKVGIDDYIAANGPWKFYTLLLNHWVAARNPDEILHRVQAETIDFMDARELARTKPKRPIYVIEGILPEGGTIIISGAPKVGKSGIVLNAAKSVCEGGLFLNVFPTRKGNVAYIQTEIPQWALSERLQKMGEIPEGLFIWTPRQFHINQWEDSGYKRTETGNRERCGNLVASLRAKGVSLAIFDPLAHFHTLNENNVEHQTHVFEVFRIIARAVPCGIVVVHHHRKTARSETQYQGAEDMRGSISMFAEADAVMSIYAEVRSDDTRRFKLVTETRHSEQPEPLELVRYGGENAWLWQAIAWQDSRKSRASGSDDFEKILNFLAKNDRPTQKKAIETYTHIPHATLDRRLEMLEKDGSILKLNGLYLVPKND